MQKTEILEMIKKTESPLKKQLLIVALITKLLGEKRKEAPIIIGGCALSYYSREIYFTADIDLAYTDTDALDRIVKDIGFTKKGKYWVNKELKAVIEVPASVLFEDEAPLEIVEFMEGLQCSIIGIEDLIIDRMNACKHWDSEIDCEMTELLIHYYINDIDWLYLLRKAEKPENDSKTELLEMKKKCSS